MWFRSMKDSRGPHVNASKDPEVLCAVDCGVGQQTPPPPFRMNEHPLMEVSP